MVTIRTWRPGPRYVLAAQLWILCRGLMWKSECLKCRHYPLSTLLFLICTVLLLSWSGDFLPPDYRVDVVLMSIAQLLVRWSSTLDWSVLPAQWGTTVWTQWDGNSGKTAGLFYVYLLMISRKWKGRLVLKRKEITCSRSYIWGGKTKRQFSSWEKKKLPACKETCKEGVSAVLSFRQDEALIKWDISA